MPFPVNIHTHRLFPVRAIQVLSADHQLFSQNLLKKKDDLTFLSLAFHPMEWKHIDSLNIESVSEQLRNPEIIAIGESGLDRNSKAPIALQMDLFRQQMQLSEKTGLPIIIHCVGRWNELELLFKEKKAGSPAWIIHGFRKTKLADKFIALGAFLSFGRALLHDERLQQTVRDLPFDRVFLETDGADVDILALYEKLAEVKSLSLPAVTEQLYTNFRTVFYHGKLA
jgi:TatD DNase family protein